MTTRRPGLRETKKQATRQALREAALRLALERGPENVRVEDIAQAAGVSPRTYNNYFSSRERAIVSAISAERDERVAAAVAARPRGVRLADAIVDALIGQYTREEGGEARVLRMLTAQPALRAAFLDAADEMRDPLASVIAERLGDPSQDAAQVLAAAVAAAVRIALQRWLGRTSSSAVRGLVVPSGSLPDLLQSAIAPLAPALDAAERQASGGGDTQPGGAIET